MRRAHLAALTAIVVIAAVATGCQAAGLGGDATRPIAPTTARAPAPPLSAAPLNGGPRVTLASHRGKPVVLNFWASWCEPCQKETPELVAFAKAHPGLDVVGIAVNDLPADSRRFAAKMRIPYELGVDRSGDVARSFGATGLPVTVIIDAEGRVADTFLGQIRRKQLNGYAEQLGV